MNFNIPYNTVYYLLFEFKSHVWYSDNILPKTVNEIRDDHTLSLY